jgi:hypothetical protein
MSITLNRPETTADVRPDDTARPPDRSGRWLLVGLVLLAVITISVVVVWLWPTASPTSAVHPVWPYQRPQSQPVATVTHPVWPYQRPMSLPVATVNHPVWPYQRPPSVAYQRPSTQAQ